MDILEMLKDKVEEIVEKIKSDDGLLAKFKADPIKVIEELVGVDLPDEKLEALADGIKAKISMDKLGDALGGLKGLFGK